MTARLRTAVARLERRARQLADGTVPDHLFQIGDHVFDVAGVDLVEVPPAQLATIRSAWAHRGHGAVFFGFDPRLALGTLAGPDRPRAAVEVHVPV